MPVNIETLLKRRIDEAIEEKHLRDKLSSGKELRLKFGIDPTAPNLHLGHSVILLKLKEFQDGGHKIILIIGDFTARIGDPSGHSETRKPLSEKEVKDNMREYLKEADKILNIKKCEVRYNSEWFGKEGLADIIRLAAVGSVQQVLHRADFKKRIRENSNITLLEALYPLFQGYDSVAIKADLEIGGTDQKFNLLMGRQVQKHYGQKEQDILTVPLLEGLDGVKKMSKSYGNYVALSDEPDFMFGKIMSLPDNLIVKYFELCTNASQSEYAPLSQENPRDAKLKLAGEIVKLYHGEKEADKVRDEFIRVFSKKEIPANIPKIDNLDSMIATTAYAVGASNSEARRLIEQGAVEVNGKKINLDYKYKKGDIGRAGKKKFFKIK